MASFACFLSQEDPKRVSKAFNDLWHGRSNAKNMKDERGSVFRTKQALVGPRTYTRMMVYQMDVKSGFSLMVKLRRGQAPRMLGYDTLATYLLSNGFKEERLIKLYSSKVKRGIYCLFKSMLMTSFLDLPRRSFVMSLRSDKDKVSMSSIGGTHLLFGVESNRDKNGSLSLADVVVEHLYRSMIWIFYVSSASRPVICLQFVHVQGLWYSKDSPLELVAYTDSDYAGATLDRKSTTGDDEAFEDDSSKQGRKLFDEEAQEKASSDTELFIQEVTPTEVIQDQEGSGKASDEVSTAGLKKEEQRAQIARDEEIARQWDEEERKRAMDAAKRLPKRRLGDGSSKNYKIFTEMLRDFDRHDVEELPEGYDLMLWGDLHTIFEPNADDELWKNQHQYNLLSWSLYDFCGIHMLLMDNGMAIHMLTEKKYPLSQEMMYKMLKKRLEVDHESSQAIELLRFIRSQVQK
ncbi:hypothetical protein Tco_0621615 [Tanacetum coccineum]